MVAIKQVSIPAIVLLSLAEQAVAAPLRTQADIAVRDVTEAVESIDLATREPGVGSLAERNILGKFAKAIKGKEGKTFDRVLSTANTGMTIANTHKAVSGKRDVEDIEERDFEELDERDLEEELELVLRDANLDLEERSLLTALRPVAKAFHKGKQAVQTVVKTVGSNKGKTFDRVLSTANTGMTIANTNKAVSGKRDVAELDERDIDELELFLREVEERGILAAAKKAVQTVVKTVGSNKGKTFDRVLSTANTGMTIANTNKALSGKRGLEDIEERDLEDIEERDWEDIEERDWEDIEERDWEDIEERDWEDIEERDWEDIEERDFDDLEERDWEDIEERDLDDLEARNIVGNVLKKVVKGALSTADIISKNQGKSYNRANAAANSAMKVAQTKKKNEKRDIEDIEERGFEERDFEYINSLSERDLEDLDLVVRAMYGDELDLETRSLFNAIKTLPKAFKSIKNVMPGSKTLKTAVTAGVKTKNAAKKGAAGAVNAVNKNKGKTFDRTLSTANTGMAIANTKKTQEKKN